MSKSNETIAPVSEKKVEQEILSKESREAATVTWREIQAIVKRMNNEEGKGSQNYHPRPRRGKTRNERERGEGKHRDDNKLQRAAWDKDPSRTGANHPTHTCNGHRYYRGTKVKTKPNHDGKNRRS